MADSTYNNVPKTRGRWWALAGLFAAAAGLFTFFVSRTRRATQPASSIVAEELSLPPPATSIPQRLIDSRPADAAPSSPWRTLAFLVLTVILAVTFIVLQNNAADLSVPLFLGLVIGAVLLAIANAPAQIRALARTPVTAVHRLYAEAVKQVESFIAFLIQHRLLFATLSTLIAFVFMIQSTQAFLLAHEERRSPNKAITLMMYGIVAVGVAVFCARPNIALPRFANVRATAVARRPNRWLTGAGIAVLLLLSEINGKALKVSRLYPITTDTQFWILILGLSMVALGLSGWNPLFRLPPIKWRILSLGIILVVVSLLVGEILNLLPFTMWFISATLNTIFFWTLRLGNLLILWAICFSGIKLQPPSLSFNTFLAILALFLYMALLSIAGIRNNLLEQLVGLGSNPIFWLGSVGLSIFIWWMGWLKAIDWRLTLISLLVLISLYVIAIISGTLVVDIAFWLAINPIFWFCMALVNLLRLPLTVLHGILTTKSSHEIIVADLEEQTEDLTRLETNLLFSNIGHYSLLIVIILVALFARFYLLNDIMRFLIDEESFILATHYLRAVPNMEILTPFSSIAAFPYVFPYWQMHTINLFGANLLGLRATSAILGVLGVAALYLLARTLFDRKTALLAALFLATFPPHIQFSRIGISEIASPLFATLALTFVARGLQHGRRMDYAIAGIMLGLTHYFHEGGRLLYTPLVVAWVVACLLVAKRTSLRSWLQNTKVQTRWLGIAVIALVLTAAPIYYTLVATDRPLFARMVSNGSGLGGDYWRHLIENRNVDEHIEYHVLPAFLVYVNQLDNTYFYADENAFVLPLLVPFFLLGLAYAIWRWRAPGMLLLLLWPLSTSLGNSLMVDSAGSPRYVMVFPVVALIIAVGLRYSLPLILHQRTRLIYGLMMVIAVALALFQLQYYFNDHMVTYNEVFRGAKASPDGYDAALRSLDFPRGTTIHIISLRAVNQIEAAGMVHLSRSDLYLDTIARDEFTDEYIDRIRCRVDHAFFIERSDFDTLNKLRQTFYLRDPQFTPYDDFLPSHRLILFYAPYIRGSEDLYGRKC